MSTVQTEQVLVVKTELFHELGYFQGFCDQPDSYLEVLLDPAHTRYLPRPEMEQDPGYKQLIPYCVFQHLDASGQPHVFHYTRGSGGGESRLRSRKSVGVGGHICSLDAASDAAYDVGMQRELDEEIEIGSRWSQQRVGLLNDDGNDVGKVHLGIVHLFTVDEPVIQPREADLAEGAFAPAEQLLAESEAFESWSQICLERLFGPSS